VLDARSRPGGLATACICISAGASAAMLQKQRAPRTRAHAPASPACMHQPHLRACTSLICMRASTSSACMRQPHLHLCTMTRGGCTAPQPEVGVCAPHMRPPAPHACTHQGLTYIARTVAGGNSARPGPGHHLELRGGCALRRVRA